MVFSKFQNSSVIIRRRKCPRYTSFPEISVLVRNVAKHAVLEKEKSGKGKLKRIEYKAHCEDCHLDPVIRQPKVAIIGAGMAGLACAHILQKCGFHNYEILEGQERPGGRIQSCWIDANSVVEFGAQWIAGSGPANPVFMLANRAGLIRDPRACQRHHRPDEVVHLKSDGSAISTRSARSANQIFCQIDRQARELFLLSEEKGHGNLYHFFDKRIKQEVQAAPQSRRKDLFAALYGQLNGLRRRWGADATEISAAEYGSARSPPGRTIRVPIGMIGALGPLLEGIPSHKIHYSKSVENIRWEGGCLPVCIKCTDGDKVLVDLAVITVSLGVLKNDVSSLFYPQLPSEKIKAIDLLGWGRLNKIFMEYACPFWMKGSGRVEFAWTQDELSLRDDWLKCVSSLEEVPGRPDMLMCMVSGQEAEETEALTDAKVAEDLTKLLRRFTGVSTIPYPCNVVRTKWVGNPYFFGSNSFLAVNSKAEMICDLAQPLTVGEGKDPVVMFAGEATSGNYFSTVQGAYFSGIREAERILDITRSRKVEKKDLAVV